MQIRMKIKMGGEQKGECVAEGWKCGEMKNWDEARRN